MFNPLEGEHMFFNLLLKLHIDHILKTCGSVFLLDAHELENCRALCSHCTYKKAASGCEPRFHADRVQRTFTNTPPLVCVVGAS